MDETARRAVERSLVTMQENLGEPLRIDDVARSAMFSKFHFTRVFQRATGITPGRFLSAMRLSEAKRLLLSTEFSVADIGHQVGFHSIGTFSTRFSCSVGMSPRNYRKQQGRTEHIPDSGTRCQGSTYTVRGHVTGTADVEFGPLFVGLFPGPIIEGIPVRWTMLDGLGTYALANVPAGEWHLYAHAFGLASSGEVRPGQEPEPYLCRGGPVRTGHGVAGTIAELHLRRYRSFDPPVLLALPDLRRTLGAPCPVAG